MEYNGILEDLSFERFIKKVDVNSDCWEWQASLSHNGYPLFTMHGKNVRAHRWIYEKLFEIDISGKDIDHLCKNKKCVNPEHLEAVTHAENVRRSSISNRLFCPRGHPLIEGNLVPYKLKRGWRECLLCTRKRN
jgi:hypothetical protein